MLLRHALRPAMIPVATLVGIDFGTLFSGALIIETMFAWPGMGRLIYDAILGNDYNLALAALLLATLLTLLGNLLADLAWCCSTRGCGWARSGRERRSAGGAGAAPVSAAARRHSPRSLAAHHACRRRRCATPLVAAALGDRLARGRSVQPLRATVGRRIRSAPTISAATSAAAARRRPRLAAGGTRWRRSARR